MAHVLIVEDNEAVCEVLMRLLRRAGHTFTSVTDDRETWELLDDKSWRFDHIIMDHEMPRMNGVELLRRAKADERTAKIPFTLMSAGITVSENDTTLLEEVCDKLGATFVAKPFSNLDALISQLPNNKIPAGS